MLTQPKLHVMTRQRRRWRDAPYGTCCSAMAYASGASRATRRAGSAATRSGGGGEHAVGVFCGETLCVGTRRVESASGEKLRCRGVCGVGVRAIGICKMFVAGRRRL